MVPLRFLPLGILLLAVVLLTTMGTGSAPRTCPGSYAAPSGVGSYAAPSC